MPFSVLLGSFNWIYLILNLNSFPTLKRIPALRELLLSYWSVGVGVERQAPNFLWGEAVSRSDGVICVLPPEWRQFACCLMPSREADEHWVWAGHLALNFSTRYCTCFEKCLYSLVNINISAYLMHLYTIENMVLLKAPSYWAKHPIYWDVYDELS